MSSIYWSTTICQEHNKWDGPLYNKQIQMIFILTKYWKYIYRLQKLFSEENQQLKYFFRVFIYLPEPRLSCSLRDL